MTITIGTWGIPLITTILVFGWAIVTEMYSSSSGGYGGIGDAFVLLLKFGGAIIVSLITWLIWALVN